MNKSNPSKAKQSPKQSPKNSSEKSPKNSPKNSPKKSPVKSSKKSSGKTSGKISGKILKNGKLAVSVVIAIVLLLSLVFSILLNAICNHVERKQYPVEYKEYVTKYAKEYKVPVGMIYATIKVESNFDPNAKSSVGANGLMQLMPSVYEEMVGRMGADYTLDDILDPEVNIRVGTYLLHYLYEYFGNWETVAAAYNAGSGRVLQWQADRSYSYANGRLKVDKLPNKETKAYVPMVMNYKITYERLY